jgi:AbiV family abortive infection protein
MRGVPSKSSKACGPLDPEQLEDVAEASMANAVVLLADARRLAGAGSVATAYSMAILAGEEFGKCQVAIGAVGRVDPSEDCWRDFWRAFYGHAAKLARAARIMYRWLPKELVERFVGVLKPALEQQRREAGLYVDVVNGVAVTPDERITEDEATDAIETIGAVLGLYSAIFSTENPLAEAFARSRPQALRMRAAIESRDREEIRRVWHETTGRALGDAELDSMLEFLGPPPSTSAH